MLKKGGGKILNLGSTGSFAPAPLNAIYCATKAYVLSFSEGISKDLEGTGITVTTLCPGATATEFAGKAQIDDVRLFKTMVMDAGRVAEIGYKALMRERRLVVAGIYNKLMVSMIRFTPRRIILMLGQMLMSKKIGKPA